ncbi:hypothetical protein [Roseivirga seohaensis]|nr:hypothetical protein [Roseivirga seohaensis]
MLLISEAGLEPPPIIKSFPPEYADSGLEDVSVLEQAPSAAMNKPKNNIE